MNVLSLNSAVTAFWSATEFEATSAATKNSATSFGVTRLSSTIGSDSCGLGLEVTSVRRRPTKVLTFSEIEAPDSPVSGVSREATSPFANSARPTSIVTVLPARTETVKPSRTPYRIAAWRATSISLLFVSSVFLRSSCPTSTPSLYNVRCMNPP